MANTPELGLFAGAARISVAVRLLRTQRSLWLWCVLPVALNLLLFALGVGLFFAFVYDPVAERLAEALRVADPSVWYGWLWVGPVRALSWIARGVLVVAALLLLCLLVTVLGGVVAAPLLDALSRRVEQVRTGRVSEPTSQGAWQGALRAMRSLVEELKRMLAFVVGALLIAGLGLVPGLQVPAAIAGTGFAALFLALDYTGYVLDRRGLTFRSRRDWAWRHRRPLLGFGGAAFATFLVPGLNFVSLPILVTAGTLLAIELSPQATA